MSNGKGNEKKEKERKQEQKHKDYYEGVLQLRSVTPEIKAFVEFQISKKEGVFVSKVKDLKEGVDYYLSSKHFIHQLGRELVKRFGGSMKSSKKLFSFDRQSSRRIYRVNVCVKFPEFKTGDVLRCGNKLLKIIRLGKGLKVFDVKRGKSSFVASAKAIEGYQVLKVYRTVITKRRPQVEVLHPETFQSTPVENKILDDETIRKGKVSVVIDDGLWIV